MPFYHHAFLLRIVVFLVFFGGNVLAGGVQALGVIPVNHSRVASMTSSVRATAFPLDELFLVKAIQRLGRRIIIRISFAPTDLTALISPSRSV